MGVSAEKVGADVAEQVRTYLTSEAAVSEHLADQLLLPLTWREWVIYTWKAQLSCQRTCRDQAVSAVRFTLDESDDCVRIAGRCNQR